MTVTDTPAAPPCWASAEGIARIASWLRQAGLHDLEIDRNDGMRVRVCLGEDSSARQPVAAVSRGSSVAGEAVTVAVKAPYFGVLSLQNAYGDVDLAPVGSTIAAGQVVAILILELLQIAVTAHIGGKVIRVLAKPGDRVGYGEPILELSV